MERHFIRRAKEESSEISATIGALERTATNFAASAFVAIPKLGQTSLENQIWECVCNILNHPGVLEQQDHGSTQRTDVEANVDALIAQRHKLQKGMARLIDSFAEGVIDKDQFTARNQKKTKDAYWEHRPNDCGTNVEEDTQTRLLSVQGRLAELSSRLKNKLSDADWNTKREMIRALVQRIEIGQTKIALYFACRPSQRPALQTQLLSPCHGREQRGKLPTSSLARRVRGQSDHTCRVSCVTIFLVVGLFCAFFEMRRDS